MTKDTKAYAAAGMPSLTVANSPFHSGELFVRQLLGFPLAARDHHASADYYQGNAGGWGEEVAVFGVHAYVDVAGVEAVMFGVGDGDEEGKDAED